VPEACDTCAFGKAGAAKEPYNRLRGMICAVSGTPFFCHHDRDGNAYDLKDKLGFFQIAPNKRKVCEGWKRAIRERIRRHGSFLFRGLPLADRMALRRYERRMGTRALEAIDEMVAAHDVTDKKALQREIKSLIRALRGN
jgi:hypothetical protein